MKGTIPASVVTPLNQVNDNMWFLLNQYYSVEYQVTTRCTSYDFIKPVLLCWIPAGRRQGASRMILLKQYYCVEYQQVHDKVHVVWFY